MKINFSQNYLHMKLNIVLYFVFLVSIFFGCKKDQTPAIVPKPKSDSLNFGSLNQMLSKDSIKKFVLPTSADWKVPQTKTFDADFESFFNPIALAEIRIAFTEQEWNGMLNDYDKNNKNETYRQASCTIKGGTINKSFPSIGIRLRGNTSRKRPEIGSGSHVSTNKLARVHFKLKLNNTFDKDESAYGAPSVDVAKNTTYKTQQLMTNVTSLNLKYNKDDPSYIREGLSYDMYRSFGVEAVRTTFAKVYITIGSEVERYVGVYLAFEEIDKTWMRKRFSDLDGAMFKCLWQSYGPADLTVGDYDGSLTNGRIGEELTDPVSNAAFLSGFSQYHPAYDLKEDPDKTAVTAFNTFIYTLNNNPTKQDLEAMFDVQSFLRYLAVNVMIGMADDYWRGGNNYYLYRNPANNNRWTFMPYDNDRTWGLKTFGPETPSSSVLNWGDNSGTSCNPVLVKRILAIPQYIADYKAYLTYMVDKGYFNESVVSNRISQMQSVISASVTGYNVGEDYFQYSADKSAILNYVSKRIAVVNAECRKY